MNESDFVRIWMEKQGIPLQTTRAELLVGPTGILNLLLALRSEIFKKDVSGYTPSDDLTFSRGGEKS